MPSTQHLTKGNQPQFLELCFQSSRVVYFWPVVVCSLSAAARGPQTQKLVLTCSVTEIKY
jgi:hypothetical protein